MRLPRPWYSQEEREQTRRGLGRGETLRPGNAAGRQP